MKALSIIALSLVTLTAAFASETTAVIPAATKGIYKVCYQSTETGNVKVSIFNSNNTLVFDETINNVNAFIRPYNFTQLSEGEYTIVIADKAGKHVEKVSYRSSKVESLIAVSKLAGFDNKYIVTVAGGADLVSVRVLDIAGNVLHEQIENVDGNYAVIYNLEQVKNQKITFEVSSGSKTETVTY